jgi:hypothetical protein
MRPRQRVADSMRWNPRGRMRRLADCRNALLVAALIGSCLPGCWRYTGRHWEEVRQGVIEPVNTAVHRHLPRDIKAKDMDAVLGAYAVETGSGLVWNEPTAVADGFAERRVRWTGPTGTEPLRTRYEHVFATFATIERAEVRIHRVDWDQRDAKGYPADVRLLVRGLGPDGSRRMLDQHMRVWLDQRDGRWLLTGEEITARELVSTQLPAFDVATDSARLQDVHDIDGSPPFKLLGDIGTSSGLAVADVDCDGYEDVALLSSSRLRLFRNAADGTFTDVTAAMGLPAQIDIAGTGLVFFDFDNDGDPDLWITGIRGQRLYRNDGCHGFTDITDAAGIGPSVWASMPIVADYDRDGWLDVFVVRMGDHQHTSPLPDWDAHNGTPDSLYHNNGDGTFTEVAKAAGVADTGWGLAGAWGDYDNDGWPDLYVGNEFGIGALYHNERNGTFRDASVAAHAHQRGTSMGVAWGDYDNDGYLDLYLSNMYANSRWALFHPEWPVPMPWYLRWAPRDRVDTIIDELSRGGALLHNNGDGTFTDVSDAAGIRDSQWGWGAEFLDYNEDGRLDIYNTNGMVTGPLLDDV